MLIQHLQAKFPNQLDEEDLGIMKRKKIGGIAFLALTEEKLDKYGMEDGLVSVIASYIEELKGTCNSELSCAYFLKLVSSLNHFLQMSTL